MQRALIPLLVLFAICAAVFAYLQYSDAADLRSRLATVTAERDAARASAANAMLTTDAATQNVQRLTAERDTAIERSKGIAVAPPVPPPVTPPQTSKETGGKSMMAGMAKMFETEEGKKMMRAQMAMGVKMQFGSIAKDLNLDPKTADQVLALLADRQAAMTEATFALMADGGIDEAAGKALGEKSAAVKKEYDEKIRAIVGDEGVKQLAEYERTAGDRMMLTMHEQQFAAAGVPLETAQRDGLLQIMKNERLKTPPSAFDASNQGDPAAAFSAVKNDAAIDKWIAQEEDFQRRVLQAAPTTLSPDQVSALQQSLQQQLEMQRFGVKMGREMFKGTTNSEANAIVAPPVPAVK